MTKWISAARPRTLPLALSSIILGSFLANFHGQFNWLIFILACITTTLLQILSNFANDYGDTQNGADLADRIGPSRSVQSGEIRPEQMMKAIKFTGVLAFISGILLLYFSFGGFQSYLFWLFIGLGILSIIAAYTYTAGKNPYGYMGLGDISVFVFFGLVGVLGTCFLYTKTFYTEDILLAIACGTLSTGVLNLNNIRDIKSDEKAGKNTIPVKIGRNNAILYHWILLAIAMICTLVFTQINKITNYYYLIAFIPLLLNGIQVKKLANPDPLLKTLALSTLLFVILVGFSLVH